MKKIFFPLIITLSLLFVTISCASKKELKEQPVIERSENFIANLNTFFVGNLNLYTKRSLGNPVISQFDVYFSPRTNSILLAGKLGIDVIQIEFTYAERKNIYTAALQYISNYENGLISQEKPTTKNAYIKGNVPISWGVFGYTYDAVTKYQVNTEYLWIEKPYYRFKLEAAPAEDENGSSPAFSIYVSPSQWQTIFELCDQATLEARCDEVVEQAEEF